MGGRAGAVRPRHRLLCVAAAIMMALAAAVAARAQEPDPARAARLMDDLMWGRGHIGGPFTLTDHTGKTRTDADFRGKLMLVYFGYTTCPDVCPTDLMQIGLGRKHYCGSGNLLGRRLKPRQKSAKSSLVGNGGL